MSDRHNKVKLRCPNESCCNKGVSYFREDALVERVCRMCGARLVIAENKYQARRNSIAKTELSNSL